MKARDVVAGWPRRGSTSKPYPPEPPVRINRMPCADERYVIFMEAEVARERTRLVCQGLMVLEEHFREAFGGAKQG